MFPPKDIFFTVYVAISTTTKLPSNGFSVRETMAPALVTKLSTLVNTSVKSIDNLLIQSPAKSPAMNVFLYSGGKELPAPVYQTPPTVQFPLKGDPTTSDSVVPIVGLVANPFPSNFPTLAMFTSCVQSRAGLVCI